VGLTLGFLPYLAAAVVAASLPLFGYHLYVEVMSSPHLSIQEIEVVGVERMTPEAVVAASGMHRGMHILGIDETQVEDRLRWLPWVGKVSVHRDLPDRMIIEVEERTIAALLVEQHSYLVDGEGHLIKEMEPQEYDPGLLVVAGLEATRLLKMGEDEQVRETLSEALAIRRDYRALGLDNNYQLSEIHFSELQGFTLAARTGQRFVLGFRDYPEKLRKLAAVLADLARRKSSVAVVRLDNEKQPWKVAVAGAKVELETRRRLNVVPAAGKDFLP